jgi:hypothetical protein
VDAPVVKAAGAFAFRANLLCRDTFGAHHRGFALAKEHVMSLFDSILSQVGGNVDIGNLAAKVGIDPAMAEKAVAALSVAHVAPGDTVGLAAEKTGLDASVLSQIVSHIGGEGSLGEFARMLSDNPQAAGLVGMLDKDGDGNPLNDLAGMAKGLFGS